MDITIAPMPDLSDTVAYLAGGGGVVIGILLVGWGRFWSRLVVGLSGVGIGLLVGGPLAEMMTVDPWIGRAAAASIFGVLGFVAAPFLWAILSGALCASVAGGFLADRFLSNMSEETSLLEPFGGGGLQQWAEYIATNAGIINSEMWREQVGLTLLVTAPLAIIPLMIGFWRQRFITIVMTSLTGAVAIVAGAMLVIVQNDPTRWFKEWSGLVIPLMVVGVLTLLGITVQYIFALAKARKKKAKEAARARSDSGSGGRK